VIARWRACARAARAARRAAQLVLVTAAALGGLGRGGPPAARADTDADLARAAIVFARDGALLRADGRGRGEVELARLPQRGALRALRTDAAATVLLADLGGRWWWMPLDGSSRALAPLACGEGPAQLAADGVCVLCRSPQQPDASIMLNLRTGRSAPLAVPAPGARLIGALPSRRLVWADRGVWAAPPSRLDQRAQVAPEAPLRGLLPSPDGARAVGVYAVPPSSGGAGAAAPPRAVEILMTFALDGVGARRKGIRGGVPVEWSADSQWVLVQSGGSACLMRALGGQYKCWRGYTAVSVSPDGAYALVLGPERRPEAASPAAGGRDRNRAAARTPAPRARPAARPAPANLEDDEPEIDDADDGADGPPADDVPVPPPAGPLALYRATLAGPYTMPPALILPRVDGAAVWLPAAP
jgi:hypothetical protein